ncbi:MAG: S16 family serine protease, partial [Anaerolineales bacterium]
SAGVTIATALVSLLTHRSVRPDLAMTGEITLRGQVLPVGGIKEKVLAAHRSCLTTVILPSKNQPDLDDLPEEVRNTMQFIFVDTVDDVLRAALGLPIEEQKPQASSDGKDEQPKTRKTTRKGKEAREHVVAQSRPD